MENSSGKRKGKPGISRRGRSRLRWVLFQLAMTTVKSNKEMKAYHLYYTTRKNNPLKKMQSLMAIAGKMTRIFYGILKNGTEYDPAIAGDRNERLQKGSSGVKRRAAPLGGQLGGVRCSFSYQITIHKYDCSAQIASALKSAVQKQWEFQQMGQMSAQPFPWG